nr:Phage-like element PbsX protein XkdW [uncultured Mediterranean phage uvMED]
MAQLSTKISLYANSLGVSKVDFTKDVMLQDDSDGNGAYIKEWNLDIAQPTSAQLDSYETAGNTAESNAQVDATRRQAYGTWGDQLDEIYHDIDAWKTRIAGVKSNNPKD